jgi:hypothetical protein
MTDMTPGAGPPRRDLMAGPAPTLLPEDPEPSRMLEEGTGPRDVAAAYPTSSLAWAVLAENALDQADPVVAYAFARTGYHRGLDVLRRNGWKGSGPVPWEHVPNQGFLRALAALARAAGAIGETEEEDRCRTFLRDSSAAAADALLPG